MLGCTTHMSQGVCSSFAGRLPSGANFGFRRLSPVDILTSLSWLHTQSQWSRDENHIGHSARIIWPQIHSFANTSAFLDGFDKVIFFLCQLLNNHCQVSDLWYLNSFRRGWVISPLRRHRHQLMQPSSQGAFSEMHPYQLCHASIQSYTSSGVQCIK